MFSTPSSPFLAPPRLHSAPPSSSVLKDQEVITMSLPQSAHVVTFIHTADQKRAKAFYQDVLGFTVRTDDGFAIVFDMNGVTMRLTEIKGYTASAHPALGWHVNDIEAAIRAITARGATMTIYQGFNQDSLGVWTSPDGKAKVAWFNDPDGNVLSLTQS
jgi:predicted enzyme related to lactoylglutathione lyase